MPNDRGARIATSLVASLVAAMSFASCRGDEEASTATGGPAATTGPDASSGESPFDTADVEFAHGMIARSRQAIEISEIALDPASGAGPEIIDLASRRRSAAAREIDVLTGLLSAWGQPAEIDVAHDHDAATPGMMGLEDLDALASSTGAAFDATWLEMMTIHHRGAITVAQDVAAAGTNPQVTALADAIIAVHQGEVAEMELLLE